MPELYGQPFKWELRNEIGQLKKDYWEERKEHRNTRIRLEYAQWQIAELTAKIQRMQQVTQSLLAEATLDEADTSPEKWVESRRRRSA
jgi:hypothetical protein